jgi:hypothetical protein
VARYALIDGYLDTMRSEIRWRRDLEDLVSEMEDHLYSKVEHLLTTGLESSAAQQATLERFGEPEVVAAVYASNNSGGIAVPTSFTKSAGNIAFLSAALWIVGLLGLLVTALFEDRPARVDPEAFVADGQTVSWMLTTLVVAGAGAAMIIVMIAIQRRHGGLGLLGLVGIAVTCLGVAATVVLWAFGFWLSLMAIGTLLFGIAALRRDVVPRVWTLTWCGGMTVGAALWYTLSWLEIGGVDSNGDNASADFVGFYLGVLIMTVGLVGLGRWLRSEEPIDIQPSTAILA